jgi:flagellar motility protein MotE (MotC chaperone)
MIRALWNIISTLAVANLLAVTGFVLWLQSSDRLDVDRVEAIRDILSETRSAEQARLEETAKNDEAEQARIKAEKDAQLPPITAYDRLALSEESDEVTRQRLERMRREVEDLQRTIRADSARLAESRSEFEAEKKAFEDMRDQLVAFEGDAQFKKTVALYETLRPAQARDLMQQLIDQGQTAQAVAYLNKMQPRTAAKIIAQFEDPALAAELLERLRTYGLRAEAP